MGKCRQGDHIFERGGDRAAQHEAVKALGQEDAAAWTELHTFARSCVEFTENTARVHLLLLHQLLQLLLQLLLLLLLLLMLLLLLLLLQKTSGRKECRTPWRELR